MSQPLEGTHLCLAHQGNYSHYAEHNCEICKLREQLAATFSLLECERRAHEDCAVRAEAAEAKLKAASEQEPVGHTSLDGGVTVGVIYRHVPKGSKLYAAPVQPVDVHQLNAELDAMNANYQALLPLYKGAQKHSAELKRKLAEQQARILQIRNYISNGRGSEGAWTGMLRVLERLGDDMGAGELNTLLAKAREESRKEAVPEGWQVVPKEPPIDETSNEAGGLPVRPPKSALDEWASYADDPALSAVAREAHLNGRSYIMNCTFISPIVKSTVPLFYSRDMSGVFMVALDGYTIAPNDRVIILPEDAELADRMKRLCSAMAYGLEVPGVTFIGIPMGEKE